MHLLDLNFDLLTYLPTFLDTTALKQLAATCSVFFDISTAELIRCVILRPRLYPNSTTLNRPRSFYEYVLGHPTHIPFMRSLEIDYVYYGTMNFTDHENTARKALKIFLYKELLPAVLEESTNIISLRLPWSHLMATVEQSLINHCSRLSHLQLYDITSSPAVHNFLRHFQGKLRRLHLSSFRSTAIVSGMLLEPLQDTLEHLSLEFSGIFYFPNDRPQWSHVHTLSLAGNIMIDRDLVDAFPNVRHLEVRSLGRAMQAGRARALRESSRNALWSRLRTLSLDLDSIVRVALTCPIRHVKLDKSWPSWEGQPRPSARDQREALMQLLKIARPRSLSLYINSNDECALFLNPGLVSLVPELAYLCVEFYELARRILEPADNIYIELPMIATLAGLSKIRETFAASNIAHLSIIVTLSKKPEQEETSREVFDKLPSLANSIPSLRYLELCIRLSELEGSWRKHVLYRIHEAENQNNSDVAADVNDTDVREGVHVRYLESVDPELARMLKQQHMAGESS